MLVDMRATTFLLHVEATRFAMRGMVGVGLLSCSALFNHLKSPSKVLSTYEKLERRSCDCICTRLSSFNRERVFRLVDGEVWTMSRQLSILPELSVWGIFDVAAIGVVVLVYKIKVFEDSPMSMGPRPREGTLH